MKVLHIIPAAFDYFDDIRQAAFALINKLSDYDVEAEAFTLQYGAVTRAEKRAIVSKAPGQRFLGSASIAELIGALSQYDLIHIHCPFLGAAGKIIAWKKEHPKIPLVVTFHRPVKTPDFFSLGIVWYNRYYLPKLFAIADVIAAPSRQLFQKSFGRAFVTNGKFYEVNESKIWLGENIPEAPAEADSVIALKYALVYTNCYSEAHKN